MTKHTVSVHVKSGGHGDIPRAVVTLETKGSGGSWAKADEKVHVAPNSDSDAVGHYELEDNQRLIIEAQAVERVVMDKDQMTAKVVPADDLDGSKTIAEDKQNTVKNQKDAEEAEDKAQGRYKEKHGPKSETPRPLSQAGTTQGPQSLQGPGQSGAHSQAGSQGGTKADHPAPGGAKDSKQVKI